MTTALASCDRIQILSVYHWLLGAGCRSDFMMSKPQTISSTQLSRFSKKKPYHCFLNFRCVQKLSKAKFRGSNIDRRSFCSICQRLRCEHGWMSPQIYTNTGIPGYQVLIQHYWSIRYERSRRSRPTVCLRLEQRFLRIHEVRGSDPHFLEVVHRLHFGKSFDILPVGK